MESYVGGTVFEWSKRAREAGRGYGMVGSGYKVVGWKVVSLEAYRLD